MADKATQGRVKLTFSAEERDKKESQARRANKGENNRLRFQQQRANGHKDLQLSDIKREVQLLRRELKGIKQTKELSESPRRKARTHKHLKTYPNITEKDAVLDRSLNKREDSEEFTYDQIVRKDLATSLPNLPVIASCVANTGPEQTNVELKGSTDTELTNKNIDEVKYTETDKATMNAPMKKTTTLRCEDLPRTPIKKITQRKKRKNWGKPQSFKTSRRFSKSEGSLTTFNLDNVKNNINRRLSISSNNTGANSLSSSSSPDDVIDSTPYMYAPPDGLPRTMFLIPPLDVMLREAKKARYIRHPRKRLDPVNDPERELDIHEIFDKGN